MKSFVCAPPTKRDCLAIGLSFASALLMSLQALHPSPCPLMNLDADQYFAFSSFFATASIFLASFLLARLIVANHLDALPER